jgi:predicted SprT family Zn-dependent metalloprotease
MTHNEGNYNKRTNKTMGFIEFSNYLNDLSTKNVAYETIVKLVGNYDDTTVELFSALQNAYNYFRTNLFNSHLAPVVLVLNRKARSMGYYRPYAWKAHNDGVIPEININPSILYLPAIEVMQTLVHEMCHHFQYLFGRPGKRGYHNKQFSRIMFSVGLMCSSTGQPGGKITGRSIADYAIAGGLFDTVFMRMPEEFILPFKPYEQEVFLELETREENAAKDKNKIKYSCPICKINAWGKPDLKLICGVCNKPLCSKLFT